MQALLKKILDQEFKSNDIQIVSKIQVHAMQYDQALSYRITLLYGDSQKIMEIYCNANRPYKPKITPTNPIEPHKLIKLCEIILEAFNELVRTSEQGEQQFK